MRPKALLPGRKDLSLPLGNYGGVLDGNRLHVAENWIWIEDDKMGEKKQREEEVDDKRKRNDNGEC